LEKEKQKMVEEAMKKLKEEMKDEEWELLY
jgi:hypothetical protein